MAAGVTHRLWDVNDLVAHLGIIRTAEGGKSSVSDEDRQCIPSNCRRDCRSDTALVRSLQRILLGSRSRGIPWGRASCRGLTHFWKRSNFHRLK
jgi:hypothetical protein